MEYFGGIMKKHTKPFLIAFASALFVGAVLFIIKNSTTTASYSYYESLKISSASLNGNSIWGGGETFDKVVAADGLDAWAAFYSATQKSSGGLDPSGALSINGVPYQFSWTGSGDYNGNDTIRLYTGHASTTVNLETIGAYEKLYVLGTAGGPGEGNYANFSVRVNYTDNTFDETDYRLYDWYDATPVDGVYKYPGLARRLVVKSSGRVSDYSYEGTTSGAPYLQSANITVDAKKLVKSIDLVMVGKNDGSDTSGLYCGIYAITGMVNVSAPNPVEVIYVDAVTETTANIRWDAVNNATNYRLDIALDPDFQNILSDYNNRLVNDTTLLAEGLTGDTVYYTRVRAENSEGQSISSNVVSFRTDPETIPPVVTLNGSPNIIQISDNLIVVATDASGVKNIEESLDGGETWTVIVEGDRVEREITTNQTYCYRATDNYDNTSDKSCITYTKLDTSKPVIRVNTNGYEEGAWTNQAITLTVESLSVNVGETRYYYSTDGENWLNYDSEVVFNGETSEDGIRYYFKAVSAAGVESDVVSVLLRKENVAPTGVISSTENSWNEFLNTITFGMFFNRTVNFEIEASDDRSGVESVEYLISDREYATAEEAIHTDGWRTVDGAITINPEGDFVLYYKLTDVAGNVAVINTDGVVLDTTKAIIRGYVDADNTYELETGKTYYLTQKIIVTDNRALDTITVNGETVSLSENNVIELRGNVEGVYTVVATDKAGNVTTVVINTGALSSLDLGLNEDNFKTSDEDRIETTKEKLEEIKETEGGHATEEELEIIDTLVEKYEDLLEKIEELKAEVRDEDERADAVPDIDDVNSSDRENIVEIIDDVSDTLDEDSTHLTIDEINELSTDKDELEDKLERIDETLEKEEEIEIVEHADVEIIKTSDKEELEELQEIAEELLAGNNLTDEEREVVESENAKISELLERIEDAEDAKATDDILEVLPKLPDGFEKDDKEDLIEAKEDLEAALSEYGNNYTDEEHTEIENWLEEIAEALIEIEHAENAEEKIDALPDPEALTEENKEAVEELINIAENLNDKEDDLIDDAKHEKLEEIIDIYYHRAPELDVAAETERWVASDVADVVASDLSGISELAVSRDNGVSWETISEYNSTTYEVEENGTYIFRATDGIGMASEETVVYHNIDSVVPVVAVDSHGYALGSWTNNPVVLTATNVSNNLSPVTIYVREQGTEEWGVYAGDIIVVDDTSSKIYEFMARSAAGLESEVVSAEVKKDSVAPSGTISSGTNSWNNFLNSLTFGLFFNETKQFTVEATDDRSGVAKLEYLLAENEMTALELRDFSDWREAESVSVDPEKEFVVYYKITDNAGNVAIINTEGIILDITPPVVQGYANGETYELDSEKVYYLTQKLLITDNKEIETITINGESVAAENGIIEIAGNVDRTVIIAVEDKAGNTTSVTIHTGKINIVDDLEHKNIDDESELEEEKAKLEELISENPSDEESALISELIESYNQTIAEIEDTEEKVNIIEESYATVPDIDHVTSDDKDKIESLIDAIETVLEENGNHLTTSEREELENMLDDLNDKLGRIEDIREELVDVDERVNSYDEETVKKDDLTDLESLKEEIETLIENTNVSDSEREHLEELLNKINDLEHRIEEAEKALEDARENDKTGDINSENVRPEDQTTLEDASQGYANALGVFDGNFSLSDLFDINNKISIINSALDLLDQVAEFEAMISRLPNPEEIDYSSRVAVKAAQIAYNDLSEYGRSLVGPSLMAKYRAVIEAYRAFLEGSPLLYAFETLDVFWWALTTFFVVGTFVVVFHRTHRRYSEAKNDKF